MNLEMQDDSDDTVQIQGIIAPYELDEDHGANSLMIFGEGEDDFRVVQDHNGDELRPFIHHLVRILGKIHKKRGQRFITVLEYEVINHS